MSRHFAPEPHFDFRPDFRRGFLRVPLLVWATVYCRGHLTRRQLQLVSVVIRESWGWQAPGGEVQLWTRPLPVRRFAAITGLSTDHLGRDLRELVRRGVLRERDRCYQFVPYVRLWKSRAECQAGPPESRPQGADVAWNGAETAAPTPGLKTGKKEEKHGPQHPGGLSPVRDNRRER